MATVSNLRSLANSGMELYQWNERIIRDHSRDVGARATKMLADLEPYGRVLQTFLYQTQNKDLSSRAAEEAFRASSLTLMERPVQWGNRPYSAVTSFQQLYSAANIQRQVGLEITTPAWKLAPEESTRTRMLIKHVEDALKDLPSVPTVAPMLRTQQELGAAHAGVQAPAGMQLMGPELGEEKSRSITTLIIALLLIAGGIAGAYFLIRRSKPFEPYTQPENPVKLQGAVKTSSKKKRKAKKASKPLAEAEIETIETLQE